MWVVEKCEVKITILLTMTQNPIEWLLKYEQCELWKTDESCSCTLNLKKSLHNVMSHCYSTKIHASILKW